MTLAALSKEGRPIAEFILGLMIMAATVGSASAHPGPLVDSKAKAIVKVTANDGSSADSQSDDGAVNKIKHVTKTATQTVSSATGTVLVWNHIKADIDAKRAATAKKTASALSDNSVSSTQTLKGKEDRKSTSHLETKIKAHIHDAKPVTVVVTVTFKNSSGQVNETKVTYTITEDKADPNKLQITDGKTPRTVKQGEEEKFDFVGTQFTLSHAAPPAVAEFTCDYSVVIAGETESVANVSVDAEFKVK